jgi:hypothetical protein
MTANTTSHDGNSWASTALTVWTEAEWIAFERRVRETACARPEEARR